MKYIQLSQNKRTIVDNDIFDYLNQWGWYIGAGGYAIRKKNHKVIHMHRVINKTEDGFMTDHINHNRLDNRRSNLRSCTRAQNMQNCRSWTTSGHKGVYWNKKLSKWQAQITHNSNHMHLGYYASKLDAKKAYIDKAKELFGEFAHV